MYGGGDGKEDDVITYWYCSQHGAGGRITTAFPDSSITEALALTHGHIPTRSTLEMSEAAGWWLQDRRRPRHYKRRIQAIRRGDK